MSGTPQTLFKAKKRADEYPMVAVVDRVDRGRPGVDRGAGGEGPGGGPQKRAGQRNGHEGLGVAAKDVRDARNAGDYVALGRRLQEAGFQVGKDGLRLKPSIVRLDVERASEKTVIAVRAELVAVEGGGRMAAMLEGAAKLSASGSLGERDFNVASSRAMDAVAKILVEDLAAKLAER